MSRPEKLTPLEKMTINIEYNEGSKSKDLAEKYNVSARTIRRVIENLKKQ